MREPGLIVLGTDTGSARPMRRRRCWPRCAPWGEPALPMKPVQTGTEDDRAPDLDFCLAAAGIVCDAELYNRLAPYRFPLPASPHLAARAAGTAIDAVAHSGHVSRCCARKGIFWWWKRREAPWCR